MTQQKREKSAVSAGKQAIGSKLPRSEILTVRLDPKLRFAAELAARKHRRTLSSFTEWAVEEAVKRLPLNIHAIKTKGKPLQESWIPEELPVGECLKYLKQISLGQWEIKKKTALEIVQEVWHPEESQRFVQLAMLYPELLTHDEDALWKLIDETSALWRFNKTGVRTAIRWAELKTRWDELKREASGEAV